MTFEGLTFSYCAPEVITQQERNSSSDIWSLGCVFLEMCTILKGKDVSELREHLKPESKRWAFHWHLSLIDTWISNLQAHDDRFDDTPLEWAASMLQRDKRARPLAGQIHQRIFEYAPRTSTNQHRDRPFCAECCYIHGVDVSDSDSASEDGIWDELSGKNETSGATASENSRGKRPGLDVFSGRD